MRMSSEMISLATVFHHMSCRHRLSGSEEASSPASRIAEARFVWRALVRVWAAKRAVDMSCSRVGRGMRAMV
jgi:hypothetical protein